MSSFTGKSFSVTINLEETMSVGLLKIEIIVKTVTKVMIKTIFPLL